jgi:hypothetical protein
MMLIALSYASASQAAWLTRFSVPNPGTCRLPPRSPLIDFMEAKMGRGLLLWLLGVPIPVILLLWLFFGR